MKQAAVVLIAGQSNAHAHAQTLPEGERILTPLQNVYALDRDPNQSFSIEKLVFSGFTTAGKNLGETQDHTASMAYYLAKIWQQAIDHGEPLPDLYIVQMSIGSQGIMNGMWNPELPKTLIPGPLQSVNISLYPLAETIFPKLVPYFAENRLEPVFLGFHWIGSEQDVRVSDRKDASTRYDRFFDGIASLIGAECPFYFYRLYMEGFCERHNIDPGMLYRLNALLDREYGRRKPSRLVDLKECPFYDETAENKGVFAADCGHYLAKTQQYFAEHFFAEARKRFLPAEGKIRIAVLGDSVTEGCFELFQTERGIDTIRDPKAGYVSLLQKRFRAEHPEIPVEFLNAGISGNKAEDGLQRLDRDVLSKEPDAVVVCYGLNGRSTPEEFGSIMGKIFQRLQEKQITTVFMTPNMMNTYISDDIPDSQRSSAEGCMKRQTNGDMDRRMEEGIRTAKAYGVTVVDAYGVWKKWASYGIDTTALLCNKINHPKREAHRLFADLLYPVLERIVKALEK